MRPARDQDKSGCSGKACGLCLFGDDFFRFVKALAALWHVAERCVDRLGIAPATACGGAKFRFANGIADADVHGRILLILNIAKCERIAIAFANDYQRRFVRTLRSIKERHNHSSGPRRKHRSQGSLQASINTHPARTNSHWAAGRTVPNRPKPHP